MSLAGLCIVPYARRSCAAPAPRLQEAFAHWARFAKLRLRTHVVASQRLKVAGAVVAVPLVSFCVQRGGWRRSRTFYLAVVVSLNRPELMEDDRTPLLQGEFRKMNTRPTQFKIPSTRPGSRVVGQRPCFSPTAP